jgi:choline dehydrogenase-like flavoprotein
MPRTSTATKDPSTTIPPPIHPNDLQNHPPWTHIIIGGGTAGLVLAHRLSSPTISPPLRVLILEAGPPAFSAPEIDIPGKFGESLGGAYDWKFETTAQEGIGGRKLKFPRGKVLGGTSALNFMTWNRGCREDYDAWEKMGNKGWGWDELL